MGRAMAIKETIGGGMVAMKGDLAFISDYLYANTMMVKMKYGRVAYK